MLRIVKDKLNYYRVINYPPIYESGNNLSHINASKESKPLRDSKRIMDNPG